MLLAIGFFACGVNATPDPAAVSTVYAEPEVPIVDDPQTTATATVVGTNLSDFVTPEPGEPTLIPTPLEVGYEIGNLAPDFTLPSAKNEQLTLSDYRGEKNVVLTFFRGWW